MRKILFLAAMMVASLTANAQNDELKNEIGVFYGFGSASNIVSSVGQAFNFSSSDQSGFWGPIGIEFYHHVTPVVAVGAIGELAGCSWKSDYKSTYITVMPSVKFNWMRKDHFGMYSSLSAGIMIANNSYSGSASDVKSDNQTKFMAHATAVGIEFGGAFRGFAELGFGEKGVLCAGLRYKF